ncbi:lipopolysaccharide transport periplasmic protein LptA [Oceanobacter sp. 5_MG-2023]|uniref:lipopolysaccharide transport periplasmic protein LptA n=1 Tax=Oceanobacter sp. 5_MG-2023 TaxID=3062645 RepID=UPI0026E18646|nr:lipopolysaccharide transport periplasmic protein LptA [Oceanobacter sp. 5_MG-2023]MDO6681984.1 lipopolysaccharide transport periplasmic protein LptA [Oceanobacter sp. 5_MG-2023]
MYNKLTALLFFGSVLATTVEALPEDWQQEMIIESDRAELDRKTGMVVYEGDVVLKQGTLTIESDRLTLILDGKALKQAIAEGQPARYQQQVSSNKPITRATAKRIDFYADRKEIAFKGDAALRQENNLFSGELIRYDIEQETVSASGSETSGSGTGGADDNQRIQVIIQPQPNTDVQP